MRPEDILTDEDIVGLQQRREIQVPDFFTQQTLDYAKNGLVVSGPETPWSKVNDVIRLRPGQLSIWAGRSGSGKSTALGQVIAWRLREQSAVIASLEMRPEQTLYRMAIQAAGCAPSQQWIKDWLAYLNNRLWVYDQLESIEPHRLLGMARYVFEYMHCDHWVLDSLTKVKSPRDDYAAQAEFVNELQHIAKRYNKHIHLICHMRKATGQGGGNDNRDTIRGVGEITDVADNVFLIARNHDKEKAALRKANGHPPRHGDDKLLDMPDAFLAIDKNREYGLEPTIGMWFDATTQQFKDRNTRSQLVCPATHDYGDIYPDRVVYEV